MYSTAYGKPEIASPYPASQRISFNLSHTNGLIVLGVAAGTALGIDTEYIRTRQAPIGIADSFFASEEVKALHQLAGEEQQERFFSYWTLKEACIKARGIATEGKGVGFLCPHQRRMQDHGYYNYLRATPAN